VTLRPWRSGNPEQRLGANPVDANATHFRVWAPGRRRVSVELYEAGDVRRRRIERQNDGYFAGTLTGVGPGARYRYVLDHQISRPDPASRFQPEGVHGPSQVVDPHAFTWTDQAWRGVAKRDLVIYELHVGAFTPEGTFRAAIERLPKLVALGVTAVELMPVAQTPGRWNWGYDGVNLFAVRNTYGGPDELKAFVDACHAHGLAALLDVVYNHVGPEGNYLADFGPYFSRRYHTPWGEAFNFDGRDTRPVRQFVLENAVHWLDEYHLDGLRLDAAHFMLDDSKPSILAEIRQVVTEFSRASERALHLIAEANVYDANFVAPHDAREAYDAIWLDCLMHAIYSHAAPGLRLAGRDYRGATDLLEVLQHGYLYAGVSHRRVRRGGSPRGTRPKGDSHASGRDHLASFVTALQTHDGVGNHPGGLRLHHLTSKDFQKAAAALALLFPGIPLMFMGEEHACDAPFPFFADFEDPRLRRVVDKGRKREYAQHDWEHTTLPSHPRSFQSAKCRGADADAAMFSWYQALLALRKRGLEEGWLAPGALTASHDAATDLFSLGYEQKGVTRAQIYARLTPPSCPPTTPCEIPLIGSVVLSSLPVETRNGRLRLQPNHAVICWQ